MKTLQDIIKIFTSNQKTNQLDASFVFPYSTDKKIKRQQIWDNLQNGLLFEDIQVFIPWLTPYSDLDKYAEQRKDSEDRTNWFLGKHKILDGVNSFISVMKWVFIKDKNPFLQTNEFLGFDDEGNKKFLELKEKFIDILGEPTFIELEKFGNYDLGSIQWTKDKVQVSLSGIEQFACKYHLCIGLKENKKY